jgi:sigma-B regulation protein RsbU (phosphoserine phosphatase)
VSFLSRSELRWQFLNIAAAIALLSIAFVAIALFFFRRKTRDLTLIYFGAFCGMYAVRLLTTVRSFRSLFDQPPTFWKYLNWDITCTLVIPFGLFFYQVGGEYFRKSLRWLVAAQTLFAVFGILAAAFGISLAKLDVANSIVVLTTFIVVTLSIFSGRVRPGPGQPMTHEMRVFITGLAVWGVFVVQANLLGLKLLSGNNLEFIGFLVFVGCLGYISAYRIFANEERLLAIHKELEIARRIQSSILPQTAPALSGLDLATRYAPMSAVAGDFYDFLLVDEKHLGVLIADVTGPTHRWKFESPAETVVSYTLMEFSRRLILRGKNLANRAAKNSWNRIGISQPRILLMIFLPASRHFPASAPLAHRRTTSPCSSSISKRRVHESSDKNSEANYVCALQS